MVFCVRRSVLPRGERNGKSVRYEAVSEYSTVNPIKRVPKSGTLFISWKYASQLYFHFLPVKG